jgi:DNA-directed RNA polymerase specialized sigma subunit
MITYDYVSQLRNNIKERIPSERNRLILELRYADGWTYDEIANNPDVIIEVRQIRRVCKKYEKLIYSGLDIPKI